MTTSPPTHIPGGCVLLARKMLDSDLMDQSPLVVKLWIWFLLKACWGDGQHLKRGQLLTTISEMQKAMSHYSGWRKMSPTPDQIRSAYGALRDTARITARRTTRGIIINVINYDTYQNIMAYASRTESHDGTATAPAATPHDSKEVKKEKTSCPKPNKPVSPEAYRLAGLLADLILENNPKHSKLCNGKRDAVVKSWSLDIDKLIRIDGQDPTLVEKTIRWCQADDFWHKNILSGTKLRKQWDTLTIQMKTGDVSPSEDNLFRGLR